MKEHKLAVLKAYCCEWDDGPYKKWAKKHRKLARKRVRAAAKKEIRKHVKSDQDKD